jgi:hypothetical protein
MKDLYANLDENNPAHEVVMRLNKKNEEIYGPYHSECGLFQTFCHCQPPELKSDNLSEANKEIYSDIEDLIIRWVNDGTKTAGTLTRRIMYMLDKKNVL